MSNSISEKIIDSLRCPVCKAKMAFEPKGCGILYCCGERRHSYDVACAGYVNMAPPAQSSGGDSKQAVRARSGFLNSGYYAPVVNTVCELLKKHCGQDALVLDAGCGEGYYSCAVAESSFVTLGFDLSKWAVENASKRAKRQGIANAFFGVASVFALPVADKSADAVINIFAPCVEAEYSRVLRNGGILIVVHAGEEHLLGLKRAIYAEAHKNESRADMPHVLTHIEDVRLKYDIQISGNESIKDLFAMTPYYWKTSQADVEKLDSLEQLSTTVDMIFSVYKL